MNGEPGILAMDIVVWFQAQNLKHPFASNLEPTKRMAQPNCSHYWDKRLQSKQLDLIF